MKTYTTVQAGGLEYEITGLEKSVKEELKTQGIKAKSIEEIKLYVQPLEGLCYFVAELDDKQVVKGQITL